MERKIYCIPGFGVDERIFSNLSVTGHLETIHWLSPLKKESISEYALRMSAKITEADPVIIGVSFGGMIAIEIGKLLPIRQIILISSVKCRKELPLQMRLIGNLGLDKIFPVKKIQQNERVYEIANRRLGAITPQEKEFANAYRRTADIHYINWSFDKILNWQNQSFPANIVHIHGDSDQIFPLKTIHPTHIIKGGTHMMVYNRPDEISAIINKYID